MSDVSLVTSVEDLPPIGVSYHLPVMCHLSASSASRQPSVSHLVWCYERADFEQLNKDLFHADWSPVLLCSSLDDAWVAWQKIFFDHVCKAVPRKVVRNIKPRKPWMTATIEDAIKAKHAAFRTIIKRHPSPDSRQNFVLHRNLVTKLLRKAERTYATTLYRGLRSSAVHHSTNFWSFAKSFTGKSHRAPIPDLIQPDTSHIVTSASDKAEVLNNFFVNQSSLSRINSSPDISQLPVFYFYVFRTKRGL